MKSSIIAKKNSLPANSKHNQELQYMSQYMALLTARQKLSALNQAS